MMVPWAAEVRGEQRYTEQGVRVAARLDKDKVKGTEQT